MKKIKTKQENLERLGLKNTKDREYANTRLSKILKH